MKAKGIADDILSGVRPDAKLYDDETQKMVANILAKEKKRLLSTGNVIDEIKASAGNKLDLTQGQEKVITQTTNTINALNAYEEGLDALKEAESTGVLKGRINSQKFWRDDVATLKGRLEGLMPAIARGVFGEVGVLTDSDIARYKKTIPGMETPEKAAEFLLNDLYERTSDMIEQTLLTAARNNRNVSRHADAFAEIRKLVNKKIGKEIEMQPINKKDIYGNTVQYGSLEEVLANNPNNPGLDQLIEEALEEADSEQEVLDIILSL